MSEHRSGFEADDFCLREIRLEVFRGFVFVNLDDHASPLQTLAGDLEQDIRSHLPYLDELQLSNSNEQGNSNISAGWKVVVDNYVECYHCRGAHPDFASIIDMDSYQVDVFDCWSRQYGPQIRSDNSAYALGDKGDFRQSIVWYLWPNTTFNVLPGPNALGVFSVRPLAVGSCDFNGHSLTGSGDVYQPRGDYVNERLSPEDIDICESVQRGLKSASYDQGAYMVDPGRGGESEHALHHFHRLVQAALTGD